jgi:hypothetical protein
MNPLHHHDGVKAVYSLGTLRLNLCGQIIGDSDSVKLKEPGVNPISLAMIHRWGEEVGRRS